MLAGADMAVPMSNHNARVEYMEGIFKVDWVEVKAEELIVNSER